MDLLSDDKDVRKKYYNNLAFHNCVDSMRGMLHAGLITVEDLATAAVLASQMYLEQSGATIIIRLEKEK